MRVLLFSQIFPSPSEPTRGPYNLNIFRALADHCEVRVIAPRPWWSRVRTPRALLAVPDESMGGLEVTYPTYWSVPRVARLHGVGMYWSLRAHVAEVRRDFPFDVILAAWTYPDAVAAAQLADEFGCPLVTKILGSDINELPNLPGLRVPIQVALGRSQRIVTVSNALRDRVIDLGIPRDRICVQHNGVDGGQFTVRAKQEARERLGLPQGGEVICAVGRLGHEKGIDILVAAMAHLRDSAHPDAELLLVGFGEMEAELRALAFRLRVAGQVRFCGMQKHDTIPDWIASCDVLCLPSRREGCPNVVLEALASGRPVVASRVGGVPELLTPTTGIMVPAEDPVALAAGLAEALTREWDPQALRRSVEFLSWADVGRAYFEIVRKAAEEWEAGLLASSVS